MLLLLHRSCSRKSRLRAEKSIDDSIINLRPWKNGKFHGEFQDSTASLALLVQLHEIHTRLAGTRVINQSSEAHWYVQAAAADDVSELFTLLIVWCYTTFNNFFPIFCLLPGYSENISFCSTTVHLFDSLNLVSIDFPFGSPSGTCRKSTQYSSH